jgi:tungstate transport system ATP-binding protein
LTAQGKNSHLFRLEGVEQQYGGRTVLRVESLTIAENSIIGLTGHNGSGKSTLLRILAFLEDPSEGRVFFRGKPCFARHDAIRKKVTLLPQEPYLLKRSVGANVAYGLRVRGETDASLKIAEALDMVGLPAERFAKRSWHELSGGEAQRVVLATRLVLRPAVLLLDEPTTSLDAESTHLIKKASIAARRDWNTTLVIACHDMPWLESVCDSILVLDNGRVTIP